MKKGHFLVKAALFYLVSLIAAWVFCGIVNATVIVYLHVAGLDELARMPVFQIGLALVETATAVLAVNELKERVLFPEDYAREHVFDDLEEDGL